MRRRRSRWRGGRRPPARSFGHRGALFRCQPSCSSTRAYRTRRAVERTVPFGLICFSVVTVWYALHGHCADDVARHRTRARWYTTKIEPSSDDMAIKLRRVIIAARLRSPCPEQATPQETRADLAAGPQQAHDQQRLRNTSGPREDPPAGLGVRPGGSPRRGRRSRPGRRSRRRDALTQPVPRSPSSQRDTCTVSPRIPGGIGRAAGRACPAAWQASAPDPVQPSDCLLRTSAEPTVRGPR